MFDIKNYFAPSRFWCYSNVPDTGEANVEIGESILIVRYISYDK